MIELYRIVGLKISKEQEEIEKIDLDDLKASNERNMSDIDKLSAKIEKWLKGVKNYEK